MGKVRVRVRGIKGDVATLNGGRAFDVPVYRDKIRDGSRVSARHHVMYSENCLS